MIASSSAAVTPARCIAVRAASDETDVNVSPGPEMYRCLMPVRSVIHSSDVSTPIATNSSFRRMRLGTACPVAASIA
jgi:hypothetical protein